MLEDRDSYADDYLGLKAQLCQNCIDDETGDEAVYCGRLDIGLRLRRNGEKRQNADDESDRPGYVAREVDSLPWTGPPFARYPIVRGHGAANGAEGGTDDGEQAD